MVYLYAPVGSRQPGAALALMALKRQGKQWKLPSIVSLPSNAPLVSDGAHRCKGSFKDLWPRPIGPELHTRPHEGVGPVPPDNFRECFKGAGRERGPVKRIDADANYSAPYFVRIGSVYDHLLQVILLNKLYAYQYRDQVKSSQCSVVSESRSVV